MATYDQTTPVNADVPPTQADQSNWSDVIGRWQKAVSHFLTNYDLLKSKAAIANASPALKKQYDKALADGQVVKNRIDEINAAIADVEDWLAGKWTAMRNVWAYVSGQVSQLFGYDRAYVQPVSLGALGQAQIIPLAVVAAAVAWVASKSLDSYNLNKKLDSVQSYVNQGYSPQAAAQMVNDTASSGSMFSGMSSALKWGVGLAGLGLAGFLLYQYYEHRKAA